LISQLCTAVAKTVAPSLWIDHAYRQKWLTKSMTADQRRIHASYNEEMFDPPTSPSNVKIPPAASQRIRLKMSTAGKLRRFRPVPNTHTQICNSWPHLMSRRVMQPSSRPTAPTHPTSYTYYYYYYYYSITPHSFIPGLKPFHRSLPFLLQD